MQSRVENHLKPADRIVCPIFFVELYSTECRKEQQSTQAMMTIVKVKNGSNVMFKIQKSVHSQFLQTKVVTFVKVKTGQSMFFINIDLNIKDHKGMTLFHCACDNVHEIKENRTKQYCLVCFYIRSRCLDEHHSVRVRLKYELNENTNTNEHSSTTTLFSSITTMFVFQPLILRRVKWSSYFRLSEIRTQQ